MSAIFISKQPSKQVLSTPLHFVHVCQEVNVWGFLYMCILGLFDATICKRLFYSKTECTTIQ